MSRRPFRIGRSLTGFGLFATRAIKKKSRIAEYKGPILDHDTARRVEARGNRYLFEVSKNRTIDGTRRSNVARYANHSCNPNCEPVIWRGRVFIKTLRNIKPGEEIVYDYGIDYLKNVIGRSNCKCSRCRRRRAKRARELRAAKERRASRLASARRTKRRKAR
jgi:SET domain-containing protein